MRGCPPAHIRYRSFQSNPFKHGPSGWLIVASAGGKADMSHVAATADLSSFLSKRRLDRLTASSHCGDKCRRKPMPASPRQSGRKGGWSLLRRRWSRPGSPGQSPQINPEAVVSNGRMKRAMSARSGPKPTLPQPTSQPPRIISDTIESLTRERAEIISGSQHQGLKPMASLPLQPAQSTAVMLVRWRGLRR